MICNLLHFQSDLLNPAHIFDCSFTKLHLFSSEATCWLVAVLVNCLKTFQVFYKKASGGYCISAASFSRLFVLVMVKKWSKFPLKHVASHQSLFRKFPWSDWDSIWWMPNAQACFCCPVWKGLLNCTTGGSLPWYSGSTSHPANALFAGFSIFRVKVSKLGVYSLLFSWSSLKWGGPLWCLCR